MSNLVCLLVLLFAFTARGGALVQLDFTSFQPRSGNWELSRSTARQSDATVRKAFCWSTESWSDFELTLDVQLLEGEAALVHFRLQDERNYYEVALARDREGACRLKLDRYSAALGDRELASRELPSPDCKARLFIRASGPLLEVGISGKRLLQVYDSTFASGRVGIGAWGAVCTFTGARLVPLPVPRTFHLSAGGLRYDLLETPHGLHATLGFEKPQANLTAGAWESFEITTADQQVERFADLPLEKLEIAPSRLVEHKSGTLCDYTLTRAESPEGLRLTFILQAKQELVLDELAFVLEPEVQHFRYHYFSGEDYGWVMFSSGSRPELNCAYVLREGKLCGVASPGSYRHLLVGYMLHTLHPEADELPNPSIHLRQGDRLQWSWTLAAFDSVVDFPQQALNWQVPALDFPRLVPIDHKLDVLITLPEGVELQEASLAGKPCRIATSSQGQVKVSAQVAKPGLQTLELAFKQGDRQRSMRVQLHGLPRFKPFLQARADVVFSMQQYLSDPEDVKYGGIFPYDFVTDTLHAVPCGLAQWGGTGELLTTPLALLLGYRLEGKYPREALARLELHATTYARGRIQQGTWDGVINPLVQTPVFRMNGYGNTYLAAEYIELARVPAKLLSLETPSTYLDWAYHTLKFTLEHYHTASGYGCAWVFDEVPAELEAAGRLEEAAALRALVDEYLEAIIEGAPAYKSGLTEIGGVLDDAGITGALVAVASTRPGALEALSNYLASTENLLGYSLDARLQHAFRWWDIAGGEAAHLRGRDVIASPNLWTAEAAYALFKAALALDRPALAAFAYDTLAGGWCLYDFTYSHNTWKGRLKEGEASGLFVPTLWQSPELAKTQDGGAGSQDLWLVDYLKLFGETCYLFADGRIINGRKAKKAVESWAPWPRKYWVDGLSVALEAPAVGLELVETGKALLFRVPAGATVHVYEPGARLQCVLYSPGSTVRAEGEALTFKVPQAAPASLRVERKQ